jgi:type III secretory pathway component EscS
MPKSTLPFSVIGCRGVVKARICRFPLPKFVLASSQEDTKGPEIRVVAVVQVVVLVWGWVGESSQEDTKGPEIRVVVVVQVVVVLVWGWVGELQC